MVLAALLSGFGAAPPLGPAPSRVVRAAASFGRPEEKRTGPGGRAPRRIVDPWVKEARRLSRQGSRSGSAQGRDEAAQRGRRQLQGSQSAASSSGGSSSSTYRGPPVAVIGGGLAGLACGLSLKRRGIPADIFDTGKRGPGGRASSRRLETPAGLQTVDHAVQAFTARQPEVLELVKEMEKDGAVRPWLGVVGSIVPGGGFRDRDDQLWIGSDRHGMWSVAKWLAKRQEVWQDQWVARLERTRTDNWMLQSTKRKQIGQDEYSYVVMAHNGKCADRLIKTAPMQTKAHAPLRCKFTSRASKTSDRLELSSLWVCVLSVPRGAARFEGAFVEGHEVLSWVSNNSAKYNQGFQNASTELWTVISTPKYGSENKCSQENIPAKSRKKVSGEMREAFGKLVGASAADMEAVHLQLWGAANPLNTCSQNFVHDADTRVGVCGDWLVAPSVEGALFSGLSLAEAIDRELRGGLPTTPVKPFHGLQGSHPIGAFGGGGLPASAAAAVDELLAPA